MNTFVIKKEHLNTENYYIGKEDLSNYKGNIESNGHLGIIKFYNTLKATGYINFGFGSSIQADENIQAGWSIKAGWSIQADENIQAGGSIQADENIQAGGNIQADRNIKAGENIQAGESIICKGDLSSKLRIFAGLTTWKLPTREEMQIKVGKLVEGKICYGELIETGLPKEDCCENKIVEIDGKKYQLKAL